MVVWIGSMAVFTLISFPIQASVDADKEMARTTAKQAASAYNLGHYDESAELYESAYRLVQDPVFLFNLGQCYRQMNKLDKALTAYKSYLRTAPETALERVKVEEWVSELEWSAEIQAKSPQKKETPPKVETSKPVIILLPPKPMEEDTPFRQDLTLSKEVSTPFPSPIRRWAPWVGVGLTTALGG